MSKTMAFITFALLVSGCAHQANSPIAADHPANPEAPAAPSMQPSTEAREPSHAMTQPTTQALYACPMHPEVTSDKPGRCYKCGMQLVKKEKQP